MTDQRQIDTELRKMMAADVPRVARIHSEALPDDFCSQLGTGFMERDFYPDFLQREGAVGLVAGESRVDGFVIGAPGAGYYGSLLRRRWPGLFAAALGSLVRRPSRMAYYFDVARVLGNPGAFHPGDRDAELLYIAVDPAAQGRSLGSKLTAGLLARLADGPYDRCVVKTLAATPENVRFYERIGFSIMAEEHGRVWLEHSLDTSSRPPEPDADA